MNVKDIAVIWILISMVNIQFFSFKSLGYVTWFPPNDLIFSVKNYCMTIFNVEKCDVKDDISMRYCMS